MTKHKPWNFRLKNAKNGFLVYEDDDQDPFMICDVFMTSNPAIAQDRAKLIAAAPDMANDLREILDIALFCGGVDRSWAQVATIAASAIKKAGQP